MNASANVRALRSPETAVEIKVLPDPASKEKPDWIASFGPTSRMRKLVAAMMERVGQEARPHELAAQLDLPRPLKTAVGESMPPGGCGPECVEGHPDAHPCPPCCPPQESRVPMVPSGPYTALRQSNPMRFRVSFKVARAMALAFAAPSSRIPCTSSG